MSFSVPHVFTSEIKYLKEINFGVLLENVRNG
jgi:hypothetical protein